jgi:tetratricopeptide (TPR) repeat protein
MRFEQCSQSMQLSEEDSFTYAMALVSSGQVDRAAQLLDALVHRNPAQALYVYWLGRIDYYQRRYDDAITKFLAAKSLAPESARIWDSLGLAYDMQGNIEEAEKALQRAAQLNRTQSHPSAWPANDLGSLQLRAGELTQAEVSLREALSYDAKLAQAHYRLGRVLEKEGLFEAAISEFRLAVANDAQSADSRYALALLFRKMHRDKEADQMFAEVRKLKALGAAQELETEQADLH